MPSVRERPATTAIAAAAATVSEGRLAGASVEPFERARSHFAYLITTREKDRFLLKVGRGPHAGRMRRFLNVAALLAEHDVAHPRVRWHDVEARVFEAPFLVQDFLPGEDAAARWADLDPAERRRAMAETGAELARLHAIPYADTAMPWPEEFADRLHTRVAQCRGLGVLDDRDEGRIISFYEDHRASLEGVERWLVHDDLAPENILLAHRRDGWHLQAFLDWQRARGKDPVADFVKLNWFFFGDDEESERGFFSAYGPLDRLGTDVPARLALYYLYTIVAGVVYFRQNAEPALEFECKRRLDTWLLSGRSA